MKSIQLTATKHMRSVLRNNGTSQDISGSNQRFVKITGKSHQHKVFQKYGTYEREEASVLTEMPWWVCDITYQDELVNAIIHDIEHDTKWCSLVERCLTETQASWIVRQLEHKMEGYKRQDREKREKRENNLKYRKVKFEMGDPVELLDTLKLIREEDLKCHYCKSHMYLMFKNVREPKQWTLDRINNHKGHSLDNVVVSCYECNIRRRQRSYQKFKDEFTLRQLDKIL